MSRPVAVVTGASRGIGRQLAVDLAARGYDVVCAARSTRTSPAKLPGTVDETADAARAQGARAIGVALDVRDEAAVMALARRVADEWGRCDLLVNNAAVAPPAPALRDSTKRWRLAVDVNVNGPFFLIYHLAKLLEADGGGRVVNISSGAALMPAFGRPSYTATKLALEGMGQALAHELAGRIAVNCVRLDLAVWTEGFAETLPDEAKLEFEDPVIMSDAVLWLAQQPLSHTGKIHTIAELRERGVVRGVTRAG